MKKNFFRVLKRYLRPLSKAMVGTAFGEGLTWSLGLGFLMLTEGSWAKIGCL